MDRPPRAANRTAGTLLFELEGTHGPATCNGLGAVEVARIVDLQFEGVGEADESNVGGLVCTFENVETPLPVLRLLNPTPRSTGTITFQVVGHKGAVQLYTDPQGTQPVPLFNQSWPAASFVEKTYYVNGFVVSVAPKDVTFLLRYSDGTESCEDEVRLTVVESRLRSLRFTSDHGLMHDNDADYEGGSLAGNLIGEPEWEDDRVPLAAFPISHSLGDTVTVVATLDVMPTGTPARTFALQSDGPSGFNFDQSVSLVGGNNVVLTTANDALEPRIQAINFDVTPSTWRLKLNGRRCLQREVGPSRAYITIGAPRDTSNPRHTVTIHRMKRAVEYAQAANSLDAHLIIQEIIQAQGEFDLDAAQVNAWIVPDDGGDCQSIVRFAQKVAKMVDIPGTFDHRKIYAKPAAPATAIEGDPGGGGLNTDPAFHPNGIWYAALVDGSDGCNAFEAVAKFTACGETRFYPGGAPGLVFLTKDDVLRVFESLSWIFAEPCGIAEVIHPYPIPDVSPVPPNCPVP